MVYRYIFRNILHYSLSMCICMGKSHIIFPVFKFFSRLLIADVKSESASTELQARIESNKQELDRYLGVYPYDRFLV